MTEPSGQQDGPGGPSQAGLRADKWLWHARFFKSRSLATQLCQAGKLRLSGLGVIKAHHKVKPGDVLTFPQARHVRVVKVLAVGARRGPASERSEEHTSELQSLMRISYAVFCLKK